jgi:hypothetical protein
MALTAKGLACRKSERTLTPTFCNSGNLPCITLSLVPHNRNSRGRGNFVAEWFLGKFLAYILSLFVLNPERGIGRFPAALQAGAADNFE